MLNHFARAAYNLIVARRVKALTISLTAARELLALRVCVCECVLFCVVVLFRALASFFRSVTI